MGVGDIKPGRVKFVSYTGKWPNLCHGILTLWIDGEERRFGNGEKYPMFWSSGGFCCFPNGYASNPRIEKGPWYVNVNKIPEEFQALAFEIDAVFNDNVPPGCCGGCI